MSEARPFAQIAKVPQNGDNVAIATERLEAGTRGRARATARGSRCPTPCSRATASPWSRSPGARSCSPGACPSATRCSDIAPGEYACNAKILDVLRDRLGTVPAAHGEDEEPEGTHDQGGGRVPGGRDTAADPARRAELRGRAAHRVRARRGGLPPRRARARSTTRPAPSPASGGPGAAAWERATTWSCSA